MIDQLESELRSALHARADELLAMARAALRAVERQVDEHAARVGVRMVHPAHAGPATRHRQQALLDQILGLDRVPHHQVRGAQQRVGGGGDELLEIGLDALGSGAGCAWNPHICLNPPLGAKG